MKIAVVSIAKNEAKHVKRWADSARDADMMVILDTGSEDDTVALAKEAGVTVHHHVFNPWRFDVARNHLLDLLPDDIDWVINLDLDEVLLPGWREHLEQVPDNVNAPRYKFVFAINPDGSEGLTFDGYKIHRRFSHRWVNAVHEVMFSVVPEVQSYMPVFQINHMQDHSKSRAQYLDLLKMSVDEDPDNDRNTYYYARELMYNVHKGDNRDLAIAEFKRHLSLPRATWNAERAFSCRYIANISLNPSEKILYYMRGVGENPLSREIWLDMAEFHYSNQDWFKMYWAAKMALNITEQPHHYLNEGWSWGFRLDDIAALAAYNLGLFSEAVVHGQKAVNFAPNDERLKSNLTFYKMATSKVDVIIPTKNNMLNLIKLVNQLNTDSAIDKIIVVADGDEAYNDLNVLPKNIIKTMVPLGSGIHVMWNLGMQVAGTGNYITFINDDVSIGDNCITNMLNAMCANPSIGLICPSYANVKDVVNREVDYICNAVYDGTGGMAGFCMMLAKDLVPSWSFDERLKWLGGDNLLLHWITEVMNRKGVICSDARCHHDDNATFKSDPPEGWENIKKADRIIYEKIMKDYNKTKTIKKPNN